MDNESPKIIEKIAFLINWPRELDMIRPLLKELNDGEFDIVMNDASGRDLLALKSIESFIENKNHSDNIVRLSDINKISEYMSVVSTGLGPIRVITIRSTVLYIYAHLIGRFFSTRFMKKILGIGVARKLMSGGRYRDLKGELYIERDIARNRICFPAELDKNISGYPNKKWRKVFDTFFSISSFDKKLLEKHNVRNILPIGYPRFDNVINIDKSRKKIMSEFNIPDSGNRKKIIFWSPTITEYNGSGNQNIDFWKGYFSNILKYYIVIVRPHPKSIINHPEMVVELKKLGLYVDSSESRELSTLYGISDLVVADYGESLLTAIYLEKALILLNLPKNADFNLHREGINGIVAVVRNDIPKIEYGAQFSEFQRIIRKSLSNKHNAVEEIKNIKNKYGLAKETTSGVSDAVVYLRNILKNHD